MNRLLFYVQSACFFVFAVAMIVFTAVPMLLLYRLAEALAKMCDRYIEFCDYTIPKWRFSKWFDATIDKYSTTAASRGMANDCYWY